MNDSPNLEMSQKDCVDGRAAFQKPRLLFITYCFPPMPAIGSVRAGHIAKHLGLLGWDVCVLCPDPAFYRTTTGDESCAELKLEQYGVRPIFTGHRWQFLSPGYLKPPKLSILRLAGKVGRRIINALDADPIVGWYPLAQKASKTLQPGDVDVVLATGNPWGVFRLAKNIARRLNVPYCLDYRDLWTANPHFAHRNVNRYRRLEAELLADCAAVTTVSPRTGECLAREFHLDRRPEIVFNGYDPEEFRAIQPKIFDHFSIVYTGQFYPPKRDIAPLFHALGRMGNDGQRFPWRFHYYGFAESYVMDAARAAGIADRVVLHGAVSRREALAAVRGANVAIVISSVLDQGTPAELGIVTGKVFDAIGLETPILAITPTGSDLEQVIATAGRGKAFCGSDIDGMAKYLIDLMAGNLPPANRPEEYSWSFLALKLNSVLRQLVDRQPSA